MPTAYGASTLSGILCPLPFLTVPNFKGTGLGKFRANFDNYCCAVWAVLPLFMWLVHYCIDIVCLIDTFFSFLMRNATRQFCNAKEKTDAFSDCLFLKSCTCVTCVTKQLKWVAIVCFRVLKCFFLLFWRVAMPSFFFFSPKLREWSYKRCV